MNSFVLIIVYSFVVFFIFFHYFLLFLFSSVSGKGVYTYVKRAFKRYNAFHVLLLEGSLCGHVG